MSMSFKASPDGTFGEILVNGQAVAKLPITGNAVIPGLVGTVSQSGGVPTGAVVERGSNANGEYVRFADGTQICTGSILPSDVWLGGTPVRYAERLTPSTFASTFAAFPTVTVQPADSNIAGRSQWVSFVGVSSVSAITAFYTSSVSGSTATTQPVPYKYIAIGRWY